MSGPPPEEEARKGRESKSSGPPLGMALIVTRGKEEGLQLDVDDRPRTIGRSKDSDLILDDLTVSRRHLVVRAAQGGVEVSTVPPASPFLVDGRLVREAVVRFGSAFKVGTTVLCVIPRGAQNRSQVHRPEARTILEGPAAEIQGYAAIDVLVKWLDAAADLAAVRAALEQWASLHADAKSAVLEVEDASDDDEALAVDLDKGDAVAPRSTETGSVVTVPAHAQRRAWITFHFHHPQHELGAAKLRLLSIAGRLFGSCLARLHVVRVADSRVRAARREVVGSAPGFLGKSVEAVRVAEMIPKLAETSVAVLLLGETGVGKSYVARLIHESSPTRHREPFHVVNCASIPDALFESELFGCAKGAYTGALNARAGAFEVVGGGTLFLDEIGELSIANQAKLLRVVEERKFERLGSTRPIEFRARIVSATHRDLSAMANEGTFRSDLLFRIRVVSIQIPPLRERGEDLIGLAQQTLADLRHIAGRWIEGYSPGALDAIRRYSWPGNVRELRNAVEHAIVLGSGPWIEPSDFPAPIGMLVQTRPLGLVPEGGTVVRLPIPGDELERQNIVASLRETGGNRTKAAALLGMNRGTLHVKLRQHPELAVPEESDS